MLPVDTTRVSVLAFIRDLLAMAAMILLLVTLLAVDGSGAASKPNIVFVLVDDWGHADVSFRNPNISTPHFQGLADSGVILNRHYVSKICSPSRASFLTGRWPHHVHQFNIRPNIPLGTNINMMMIPAKLKTAGYKTHMVGKWHMGFYDPAYLPVNRGFDTSSGFLSGAEDHLNQKRDCAVDFWKNQDIDARIGTYDAYTYRNDLTDMISNHDTRDPFFLYLPLHNVHGPFQAPQAWLDLYPEDSTCAKRRTYQAMVSVADNVTGHVVQLLKMKGMWDNTLIVVSADNGGAAHMASNYPLKGGKGTFFEGGVRALAFASGGLIPHSMKGMSTDGFIHIADWYTTFCNLAGVDPQDSGPGKFPVDGLDVWPILTGSNTTSPHKEIVLGYDFNSKGAIISGNYKLIVGSQGNKKHGHLMWSPLDNPCSDGPKAEDCDSYCLYDIVNDPEERENLVDTEPDKLKELLDMYHAYSKEPRDMQDKGYHTYSSLPVFNGACKYMAQNGGYWRPWTNLYHD